jgi:flagellin FlaB
MKKAEMGIGTLIIFISMIIVASIAAGVLLQTASTLQNKALDTGKKTEGAIGTSVNPIMMAGEDGQDGTLENFYIKAKLNPGSDPIKLADLLVGMYLSDSSADLEYKGGTYGTNCSYGPNGFYTKADGSGNYTVRYLINGTNNKLHYLSRGDVIEICFRSPVSVSEDTEFTVNLVPKIGTLTQIKATTPDVITDKRVVVFP